MKNMLYKMFLRVCCNCAEQKRPLIDTIVGCTFGEIKLECSLCEKATKKNKCQLILDYITKVEKNESPKMEVTHTYCPQCYAEAMGEVKNFEVKAPQFQCIDAIIRYINE